MKWIYDAAEFMWKVRHRLRFGELSRSPLKLLRLELREDCAECEWLARASDPWDADLPIDLKAGNEVLEALRDALAVRKHLFASLPQIRCASFRVYRAMEGQSRELIIAGSVSREDEPPARVASLVMRAKLCGLRFNLSEGVFEGLSAEVRQLQLIHQ